MKKLILGLALGSIGTSVLTIIGISKLLKRPMVQDVAALIIQDQIDKLPYGDVKLRTRRGPIRYVSYNDSYYRKKEGAL